VALGKGLSAGYMPLGAVMASGKVVGAFEKNSGIFEHGFTYSGHPVAAAAGLSVLQFMEKHALVSRVGEHESKFFNRLSGLKEKYEIVGDIRGRGYMAGLELVEDRNTKRPFAAGQRVGMMLAARARELGLLIYPGSAFLPEGLGDHVMIAPPFVIAEDEMNQLFERLEQALQSITESLYNVASTRSS
jgi:adenosylmethionine-8-amino-7-oxononanoate aminotransferase